MTAVRLAHHRTALRYFFWRVIQQGLSRFCWQVIRSRRSPPGPIKVSIKDLILLSFLFIYLILTLDLGAIHLLKNLIIIQRTCRDVNWVCGDSKFNGSWLVTLVTTEPSKTSEPSEPSEIGEPCETSEHMCVSEKDGNSRSWEFPWESA